MGGALGDVQPAGAVAVGLTLRDWPLAPRNPPTHTHEALEAEPSADAECTGHGLSTPLAQYPLAGQRVQAVDTD